MTNCLIPPQFYLTELHVSLTDARTCTGNCPHPQSFAFCLHGLIIGGMGCWILWLWRRKSFDFPKHCSFLRYRWHEWLSRLLLSQRIKSNELRTLTHTQTSTGLNGFLALPLQIKKQHKKSKLFLEKDLEIITKIGKMKICGWIFFLKF